MKAAEAPPYMHRDFVMGGVERGHACLACIGAGNRTSAMCCVGMRNMRIQGGIRPDFDTEQPKNVGLKES